MVLKVVLPLGKNENVKDLVFTILAKEYPLKIISLLNLIKKRYGKSVTFQAVRKAVLSLVEEGVLLEDEKGFSINKKWIHEAKSSLEEIYKNLTDKKVTPKNVDSIQGEISVFTFGSLSEMMSFWEEIIDDWFRNFKKGDYNVNCWQGAHVWEGLLHLEKENKIMGQLKKKGIRSYAISSGSTPLDRNIWKFYRKIGLKTRLFPSSASFDKSNYLGTYGEMIVQTQYPKKLVGLLDDYFKKNKSLESLDLGELSKIINKKYEVKLTVIKNLAMAKQINKSIIEQFN
jgi:hypothetical protein